MNDIIRWFQRLPLNFIKTLVFLTTMPIKKYSKLPTTLVDMSIFFPIVALIIGGVVCLSNAISHCFWQDWPTAIITVMVWMFFTGGAHLDGVADVCDGILGGYSKEERLEIMRDSRLGTYGSIGLFFILFLKCAFIASLCSSPHTYNILLITPVVGRWSPIFAWWAYTHAIPEPKLGKMFDLEPRIINILTVSILTIMFTYLLCGNIGVIAFSLTALIAIMVAAKINKKINGITGDACGFLIEFTEVVFMAIMIAFKG